MEDLTDGQVVDLAGRLRALRDELRARIRGTRDDERPVAPDRAIGRLTRLDAIQQQHMSAATRREADLRLRQVEQALRLVDRDEYGICRRCEDPIGFPRLSARPESPYCLACQDEIDRRHG